MKEKNSYETLVNGYNFTHYQDGGTYLDELATQMLFDIKAVKEVIEPTNDYMYILIGR